MTVLKLVERNKNKIKFTKKVKEEYTRVEWVRHMSISKITSKFFLILIT